MRRTKKVGEKQEEGEKEGRGKVAEAGGEEEIEEKERKIRKRR